MWELLNKPEVIAIIGTGLALLLPRQVWEVFPIVRLIFSMLDAASKANEAEAKAKQLEAYKQAAIEAVKGAEQLKKTGKLDNQSAKAYAVNLLRSTFGLDEGTAELLVESAVLTLNNALDQ